MMKKLSSKIPLDPAISLERLNQKCHAFIFCDIVSLMQNALRLSLEDLQSQACLSFRKSPLLIASPSQLQPPHPFLFVLI